jgi:rare lipoprotein A
LASYYAEPYHGHRTASGEIFDTYQGMTAAHRTLPFNTFVRVTNKTNGRQVDVRINDRGPFVDGRVIDLSLRAAREIDLVRAGIVPVKLKVLKQEEVARPAVPSSPSGPIFAVQVGAFENQRAAEDLKHRLERKYTSVTVQAFSGEKTIYRVRIGREPDLQAAEKLASQLRREDLKPFVVRMN